MNGVGTHTSRKVWIRGHRGDDNTAVFIEEAPGRDGPHMVVMSFEDGLPGPFIAWPVDDVPDLLAVLASDIGRVWSFATLTQQLWGTDLLGDKDPLTSTVKRLRRRLGAAAGCQVASVHGIGYRLRVVTS